MSNQLAKVRREAIAACMTCPLCNKLFRDATTISECLHTFCRKCIHEKLMDEEPNCPVCNIRLGALPLEKLRPDHNLKDVTAKIFRCKRRKVSTYEAAAPITVTVRRKERLLSSLVVDSPKISAQTGLTGRRSDYTAKKALQYSSFSSGQLNNKQGDASRDLPESSSSPDTLKKLTETIRQNPARAEPYIQVKPDLEKESDANHGKGKSSAWKTLNYLVKSANRSKPLKYTSQGSAARIEPSDLVDGEGSSSKTKAKELGQKLKLQDGKNISDLAPSESGKPKKSRRKRPIKSPHFEDLGVSPQTVLETTSSKYGRRSGQVWFSLVASEDQEGNMLLPQISASYLRIKDGSLPVSFIQKYLMRKLNLTSEDEVEIKCMGQLIVPTLALNDLVESWLQSTTSDRVPATVGSSAKDFVMVLKYARRISAS